MANTGGPALPRLDTAFGYNWRTQSPHTRLLEAITGSSLAPVRTLGHRGIPHQCNHWTSLLCRHARLLHCQRHFSDQDVNHIACRSELAALLLHQRVPSLGTPGTWGRRTAIRQAYRSQLDIPVDRGHYPGPLHTVW